jgi:hypothetical protein
MNLHKAAFPPFRGGMQAGFWISRRRWLEESREAIARCNLKNLDYRPKDSHSA